MQADGSVIIDTHIETADFGKGISVLKKEVSGLAVELSNLGDRAKLALQKQMDSIERLYHSYSRQEQKVEQLRKSVEEYGKAHIPTDEYKEIEAQIARDTERLNKLVEAQERFVNSGGKENSAAYKRRAEDIMQLRQSIEYANSELKELEETGNAFSLGSSTEKYAQDMQRLAAEEERLYDAGNRVKTAYMALAQAINEYRQQMAEASRDTAQGYGAMSQESADMGNQGSGVERLKGAFISLKNSVGNTAQALKASLSFIAGAIKDKAAGIAASVVNGIAHPFQTVKNIAAPAINLTANGLKRMGSAAMSAAKSIAGKLLSGLKKAGAAMLGFHKSTKKSSGSLGSSLKTMLKYGLGIRSVFVLVNKLRSALVDGFKNLAQYDGKTNTSISMLKSSLTQLKNSFATAFAPIFNVAAPALTAFINMVSKAVTYVGMLVAALTGQSAFTKATAVQEDYAASLGDSADATEKADKANKTYLSGLDEIARWESSDKESDTGNSGGYAAPTPQDMFETVPIESSIKGIAEKIRSLVQSEDWEGLGSYVASGINNGMAKINEAVSWDNVGGQVTYFVNAFTTTFNSLVDNVDWNLIGSTVGEGINTIVNAVNLLITGIDWVNLGLSFASGINGLVTTVDWNNLGNMLGNYFMISWQIFYGFVAGVDWSQVGTAIANGINGVFEAVDLSLIASGIATFVNGISTSILNFALATDWTGIGTKIFNAINTFLQKQIFRLWLKASVNLSKEF